MTTGPLLKVRNLRTVFQTPLGTVHAVNDVSLDLHKGEILGLVGESGSGKSMLGFSIMNQIAHPGRIADGSVEFEGRNLARLSQRDMRSIRGNRIAMVFQDPMVTLNPVLRIETQMIEAIKAHGKASTEDARARARDALGKVGIPSPEERLRAFPHQFSGGMRQRVAIAIALLNNPDIIIADEPTTALDVTIQAQICAQMLNLVRSSGIALIWISHDLSVVSRLADRIAVMYAGRLIELGDVREVVHRPRHPYTRGLIDSLPSRVSRGERLRQIPGSPPNLARPPAGCPFHPRCNRRTDICLTEPPMTWSNAHGFRCVHPLESASIVEPAQ